jgi:ABC-type dipeptide/oligopeptide/nickel transport system permease component
MSVLRYFLLLVIFIIIGCSNKTPSDTGSTLRLNISGEPPTLDWTLATDSTSFHVITNIMDGLTQFDSSLNPVPAIAKKWVISNSGKRYTLKIFPPALWEGWSNMILPAITLGISPTAYIARLTRASILDVLHKDFVRTAFAKGLPYSKIILKHVLKNALTPIISVMGPILAGLVAGSFVVEYIFSIPGMGRYFITAVTDRDYPLIMATTMVYAVLIVFANIIVDVLYKVVDPRVRLE